MCSSDLKVASSFAGVIAQIIVIDLVFSLDSIITPTWLTMPTA